MTPYWIGLTAGIFIGASIGVFAMALFIIGKKGDEINEHNKS